MAVSTTRTTDFDHTVATLGAVEADHRYAVAWIDATATGRRSGRGVVSAGNHLDADEVPAYRPPREVTVPAAFGRGPALVTPAGIRMFNELWYRKAPKRAVDVPTSIAAFFHPLDGVAAWNRLYGRRGFVQYQSVVPEADQVRAQLRLLTERGAPSAVTVLKRFGAGNPAMLSFPTPGWTLAVDIPATVPDLRATLDDLDRQVVAAGGRIYLAKDGRSRAADLAAMYPRLDEWRRIVDKLDPEHRFQSDLSRRLGIRGEN
jgi:decaprenylphospho-beta-D-ribofuranose 2-oxidase